MDEIDMRDFEKSLLDPDADPRMKDVVDRVKALLADLQQDLDEIGEGLQEWRAIDDFESIKLMKVAVEARINNTEVLITVTEGRGPRVTVRKSPYDRFR